MPSFTTLRTSAASAGYCLRSAVTVAKFIDDARSLSPGRLLDTAIGSKRSPAGDRLGLQCCVVDLADLSCSLRDGLRPREDESSATYGWSALNPDLTAVALDHLFDNRQANATRFNLVSACQGLEDHENAVMELWRYARSVISDTEFRHAGVDLRRDGDTAFGAIMVLQRIADQIFQDHVN